MIRLFLLQQLLHLTLITRSCSGLLLSHCHSRREKCSRHLSLSSLSVSSQNIGHKTQSEGEQDGERQDEPFNPQTLQRRNFLGATFATAAVLATTTPAVASAKLLGLDGSIFLSELPSISKIAQPTGKKRIGGLAGKIRSMGRVMDELQRDLMQERWDLVETYPPQLRTFVPLFTTYTDSAFPSELPTDKGLRVALRYEVGRFFASLERLRQATARRALNEAYIAYSDMSLHYDRYMRVGGIYTYYDDSISNEPYFKGISEDALVYSDPVKDPAEVRDLVVMAKGPDKGKTGILIGIYPDGSNSCVVKLDRIRGMRQILVVPRIWVAKRLGEQLPDEAFLIPRKNENNYKSFI